MKKLIQVNKIKSFHSPPLQPPESSSSTHMPVPGHLNGLLGAKIQCLDLVEVKETDLSLDDVLLDG